jgi:hypothetical protein
MQTTSLPNASQDTMTAQGNVGFAPSEIRLMLRVEGLVLLSGSVVAYQYAGGSWWVFAVLFLVPDLSMLGLFAGQTIGARVYNLVHTTTAPAILGGTAFAMGATWLVPVVLIWIAHIGLDRAVGFGMKYPQLDYATHLGWIGKPKKAPCPAPTN